MNEQTTSLIKSLLVTGVVIAGFAGAIIMALPKVDQYLKLKAFDDCAKASTYTYESAAEGKGTNDSTKSIQPVKEFYVTCIKDKGYKTNLETK